MKTTNTAEFTKRTDWSLAKTEEHILVIATDSGTTVEDKRVALARVREWCAQHIAELTN
jgi:hypothetical protein